MQIRCLPSSLFDQARLRAPDQYAALARCAFAISKPLVTTMLIVINPPVYRLSQGKLAAAMLDILITTDGLNCRR